ncbi:arginine--tRNA ligase [Allorhizocola rhizosphaerae]|uniref:arginine--tRNA ligase n=1 Tax=Allorhizocola rhizosphaerae TaxID=1872709 RepID=UPI000E3C8DE9|nr:arginine--tRNA ligase [Allorhizocola rhizosphaerae]
MSLRDLLSARLGAAFATLAGEPVDPLIQRSAHADFQANGALPLARKVQRPAREVAGEVLAAAELTGLATGEVSGPGFINLTVLPDALDRMVAAMAVDERLGVPMTQDPEPVIVDYSGPNVAKEMHVGHLRSTIIGDCLVRVLRFAGHDVTGISHTGDWGTPFGMLLERLVEIGEAAAAHELSVGDLDGFYKAARLRFDSDPAFADRARRRVVLLQGGDAETLRLWRVLVAESQRYFMAVNEKLGVLLTEADYMGESFYNDRLAEVVHELDGLGLLRPSDGAQCVFPAGFTGRDGGPFPMIVRKRDGGFGYSATDLAAIRYRIKELKGSLILYVVGAPQSRHLRMVFAVAGEAGWLRWPVRAQHVAFGSILGEDGRMLKSRAGRAVKLSELLDEAVSRAAALVAEKSPQLDPQERAEIARAVGVGAVKYADLSTDMVKDYVFDLDRMLAFTGDTAGYLQYTHARVCSILRKAGGFTGTPSIVDPAERALALELLAFPDAVQEVADEFQPHKLTGHLRGLAVAFTAFWDACPVLRASPPVRESRLVLCDLTARTLRHGLDLLGIHAPQRM